MNIRVLYRLALAGLVTLALTGCQDDATGPQDTFPLQAAGYGGGSGGGGGGGHDEGAGNNLSLPVIWAEGATKALRGTPGAAPVLDGSWWWWWGTAADDSPLSCAPGSSDPLLCADGSSPGADARRAYLQKDAYNVWQAGTFNAKLNGPVNVNWIDWGDDLEAKPWTTTSMVRVETVLYQDIGGATAYPAMTGYTMRHLSGWGIDEVWGLSRAGAGDVESYESAQATVFTECARLTIQKLNLERSDPLLAALVWDPVLGQWANPVGFNYVNAPLFKYAVHESQDGPGYYNAEVNVKGSIIFGYTWNARRLNDGAGDYRITFSLDEYCPLTLNTHFVEGTTAILAGDEEEDEHDSGGGVGVLDFGNNLTYIDVRLTSRSGGGGGGRR